MHKFNVLKILNIDLFLLTGILLFLNLPYLQKSFLPVVDTLVGFHTYYHFYNQFFYHGTLALWFPYGTFGIPGHFLFMIQTISSYFFMVLGALCRIKDVLLVYKLSIFFEQLLFLLGLYLLSNKIFSKRSTTLFVCLIGVGSIVWYSQYCMNFRIYYLFPLVLFLLVSFFSDSKPEFLWLSGIVTIAWALGNAYCVILWFYVFVIILIFLTIRQPNVWRCLWRRSGVNILTLTLFIILLAIYAYYQLHTMNDIFLQNSGRDPVTKKALIESFINYGGNPTPAYVVWCFIFGWPTSLPIATPMDNTVYMGILPLIFFIWALVKVRNLLFWGITAAIIMLVWFSFGGFFTRIAFYFPAMSYYRHVGLVYALVKILMILAAGFGWENFWNAAKRFRLLCLLVIGFAFLTDILLRFSNNVFPPAYNLLQNLDPSLKWFDIFGLRAGIYFILTLAGITATYLIGRFNSYWRSKISNRFIKFLLIAGLVFDLSSFQYVVWVQATKSLPDYTPYLDSVLVHRLEYQKQRLENPATPRQQNAYDLTNKTKLLGTVHATVYNFMQFDSWLPRYRADWWSPGVYQLLQQPTSNLITDDGYHRILGWNQPKLRLVPYAIYVPNENAAWNIIRGFPYLGKIVVLKGDKQTQNIPLPEAIRDTNGNIRVTYFDANKLTAEVDLQDNRGAWLVYADAFNPGWHAKVDGKETPIEAAYLAFKAVWLNQGKHLVQFEYHNGWMPFLSYTLMLFSCIFEFLLLIVYLTLLFPIIGNRLRYPVKDGFI